MTAVLTQTAAAIAAAAADARAGWRQAYTAGAALFAAACALPWFAPGWVHVDELAAWLYLALSATGLVITVGLAGLPSLGQGAFMTVGALTTGLLVARAGWPAAATLPAAVGAALALGVIAGLAVARLTPLFLAVSTWIVAWLVLLVARAFPGISGGAQGYVVDSGLSTTGHYELGLVLTALAVLGVAALRRGAPGIRLRALRDRAPAAAGLGVPVDRLLLGAFAASAAVAGLAGSLSVQLAGVTDPDAFGPVVSFRLLAAVLLGGAAYAASGVVGVAVLGGIALFARLWAHLQVGSQANLEPMFAAVLLLCVLALGDEGVAPVARRIRARGRPADETRPPRLPRSEAPRPAPAVLSARGLSKRYGGVRALDGFDLEVQPGESVALVGANGSGKTTALRALAGALRLDAGEIDLDGRSILGRDPGALAGLGVIRTLQRTATFGSLTALESAIVGASLHARTSGPWRSVVATPKSRAEARRLREAAFDALETVRLERQAGIAAGRLDGFQQRRLMLAAALAARPRLLLLDEPSAGAARAEVDALQEILEAIRANGLSLVVVEHDLRLAGAISDRIVAIRDGKAVNEALL